MRELAMIQEGLDQLDRGEGRPLDDVVRDFASQGMLNLDAYIRDREHGRQEPV